MARALQSTPAAQRLGIPAAGTRGGGSRAARLLYSLYIDAGGGSGIGDAISRVTALSAAATRPNETNIYAAYAYNGAGRIVLETQKHEGDTVAELDYYQGTAGTYAGFDRFGRVVDQKWTDGTDPIDRYGYGYDANSNRIWRENSLTHGTANKFDEFYTYDGLDRLTVMKRGTLTGGPPYTGIADTPVREEDWTLNQTGNWAGYDVAEDGQDVLVQERDNNKANEIIEIDETTGPEWVTPEWDARGNMIYGPRPGDEATEAEALLVVYDAWNRPVEFWEDTNEDGDLDDPGDTQILECRYDGTGRRIQKTVKDDPDVAFDYYYNMSWQVLEVRKDASTNPYEQYVWGLRYVHSPVLRWWDENTDGQNIETHYYTNDANFNVTALVNTSGTVVERVVYDPYGKPKFYDGSWANPSDTSAYDNAILYCGYYHDWETGLYHVRHRYYHPMLGRWMQRDPGGYRDGMGLYEYVRSAPGMGTDPTGRVVVTISGFLQKPEKLGGLLETVADEVQNKIQADNLDATGRPEVDQLPGGWGAGIGEGHLRNAYSEFVDRKKEDSCSLEQFVAVGHSDGATAIYHLLRDGEFDTDYPPAYLAMIDMVRKDYGPLGLNFIFVNMNPDASVQVTPPSHTILHNFRQISGGRLDWKGYLVQGAHLNVTINKKGVKHMEIAQDIWVHNVIAFAAAHIYVDRVYEENRPRPWERKLGQYW